MAARRSTIQSGLGPHLAPADDADRVARAACRVIDGHAHGLVHRRAVGSGGQLRHHLGQGVRPIALVHGTHLARKARDREAVGTVRRDLQVQHRVGELRIVRERHAHGRVLRQDPDALVIGAQAQLAARAAHAGARHAAQLRLLDLEIAGQHRAHGSHRHLDAGCNVRRAAHDLHRLVRAHVHRDHVHVVAVGMRLARLHVPDHHAVERRARLLDALHARARQVEPVAELLHVSRHVHILSQPFKRYFHVVLPILKTLSVQQSQRGRLGAPNRGEGEGDAYFGTRVFGFAARRGAPSGRSVGSFRRPSGRRNPELFERLVLPGVQARRST